jgi:hypothetical protein
VSSSYCRNEGARAAASVEITLSYEHFECECHRVSAQAQTLGELAAAQQPRAVANHPTLDRVAQAPRKLDREILPRPPVREKRLEEDRLLHLSLKWPVTGSHSCCKIAT